MTTFSEADLRILGALETPRTAAEISDALREALYAEWEEEEGVPIMGLPSGRLLAWHCAEKRGTPMLASDRVDARLRKLERAGLVERLQVEGQRPMLWRKR